MHDLADTLTAPDQHLTLRALGKEHVDNLPCGPVAKQLAKRLLVPGDGITFDQLEEIARTEAAQRRLGEMGVGRKKAVRRGIVVGEIAASAAGYQDLPPRLVGVIEEEDLAATGSGL